MSETTREQLCEAVAQIMHDWRYGDNGTEDTLRDERACAVMVVDTLGIESYGKWHHRTFTDELERDSEEGGELFRLSGLLDSGSTP